MADTAYVVRVRIGWMRSIWREIVILGSHTLHELHSAILDAFEWSDDAPYTFYMNNEFGANRHAYTQHVEQNNTHYTHLANFELDEGDAFLYVYADQEEYQLTVRVMIVDDPSSYTTYPDVVDENGDSPDQPNSD